MAVGRAEGSARPRDLAGPGSVSSVGPGISPGKRGLGVMSDLQLALTRLVSGPGDSLERWSRSSHCPLDPLGGMHRTSSCWPQARQGHPGGPQPRVGEESRLEESVTPKMKTTCRAWLSLKPQTHSSLPLPLLLPSRSSPGCGVWGGRDQRPSGGELQRQGWLSDGCQALSLLPHQS